MSTLKRALMVSGRFRVAVLVVAAILILPSVALAWDQFYVRNTNFGVEGIGLSDFNSGLNDNEVDWNGGPGSIFGTSLCNSSYQCYTYDYWSGGWGKDTRSISYGRAKCYEPNEAIYVNWCYTHN